MIYHSERPDQGRTHTQSKFEDNRTTMKNDPLIQNYNLGFPSLTPMKTLTHYPIEIIV